MIRTDRVTEIQQVDKIGGFVRPVIVHVYSFLSLKKNIIMNVQPLQALPKIFPGTELNDIPKIFSLKFQSSRLT